MLVRSQTSLEQPRPPKTRPLAGDMSDDSVRGGWAPRGGTTLSGGHGHPQVLSLPPDPPRSTASSTAKEDSNAEPSTNDDYYDDMKKVSSTDLEE